MTMAIGRSVQRKESREKVTGRALYAADLPMRGVLSARLLTSPCAHARIESIDISRALAAELIAEEWLSSNLCRCTSYQDIRSAVKQMFE